MTRGRQNQDRARVRLRKPKPPGHLTAAEADIWTKVCADQDGQWCDLAASGALLEMYCQALAHYRLLVLVRQRTMDVATVENESLAEKLARVSKLSNGIAEQASHVASLERGLRLTPQSRVRADGSKNEPPAPWEQHPEDDGDTA